MGEIFIKANYPDMILRVDSDAARSWGGSAVLGVSPMSNCRGFHGAFKLRTQVPQAAPPHERLHQDSEPSTVNPQPSRKKNRESNKRELAT